MYSNRQTYLLHKMLHKMLHQKTPFYCHKPYKNTMEKRYIYGAIICSSNIFDAVKRYQGRNVQVLRPRNSQIFEPTVRSGQHSSYILDQSALIVTI